MTLSFPTYLLLGTLAFLTMSQNLFGTILQWDLRTDTGPYATGSLFIDTEQTPQTLALTGSFLDLSYSYSPTYSLHYLFDLENLVVEHDPQFQAVATEFSMYVDADYLHRLRPSYEQEWARTSGPAIVQGTGHWIRHSIRAVPDQINSFATLPLTIALIFALARRTKRPSGN
jgi:hypothetical protein